MEENEFPNAVPYLPSLQGTSHAHEEHDATTPRPTYRPPLAYISSHHIVRFCISVPIAYFFFFMAIFASDPGTLQSAKVSQILLLASFLSVLWGVVGHWYILYLAIASLFVAMLVNAWTSVPLILWDVYYYGVLSAAACLVAVQYAVWDRMRACWSARRAKRASTPNNDNETPYTQELMT